MKYNYKEGLQRQKSRRWVILPVCIIVGLIYAATVYFAPLIYYVIEPADRTAKYLTTETPGTAADTLYIPKINATIKIVGVETGERAALEKGAVQRATAAGNPKDGGTYVLAANQLSLGLTPRATYAKSPLYHIGKLSTNDDLYIDYKGARYAYKVTALSRVESDSPMLQEKSDSVQLRLYTADLDRDSNQRDMLSAKLIGKVIWVNGQPKLQSL